MLSSTKRLAFIAVVLMALLPLAAAIYSESSSADGVDYTRYYYNQLDSNEKTVYDKIVALKSSDNFTVKASVLYPGYETIDEISEGGKLIPSEVLSRALDAVKMDYPLLYWSGLGAYINVSGQGEQLTGLDGKITLKTIDGIPFNSTGDSVINSRINAAVSSGKIVVSDDDIITLKSIHDYLIDRLTYATEELEQEKSTGIPNYTIRSMYTSIAGNYRVVCEGYAKAFKYLCDKYDIPCLIVVGEATSSAGTEKHMWNLAMVESTWYIVDCTWDDPIGSGGRERDDYFLVGTLEAYTHDPSTTTEEYGFVLPSISMLNYGDLPEVTVDFDEEGIPSRTVTVGEKVTVKEPSKQYYTFGGWYKDPSFNTKFENGSRVYKDTTLYAKWVEADKYTITFSASDDATGVPAAMEVYKNEEATLPSKIPSLSGFRFDNWNTKEDGKGIAYQAGGKITVTKNTTLYAQWVATYTLSFSGNGGTNVPDNIVADKGSSVTIPKSSVTKIGWQFTEWNTLDDGAGKSYKEGDEIVMNSDITLYAQWKEAENPSPTDIIGMITAFFSDLAKGIDDFAKQTEAFLGKPWIGGIPNLYVVIGGAAVFFIIAATALNAKKK